MSDLSIIGVAMQQFADLLMHVGDHIRLTWDTSTTWGVHGFTRTPLPPLAVGFCHDRSPAGPLFPGDTKRARHSGWD